MWVGRWHEGQRPEIYPRPGIGVQGPPSVRLYLLPRYTGHSNRRSPRNLRERWSCVAAPGCILKPVNRALTDSVPVYEGLPWEGGRGVHLGQRLILTHKRNICRTCMARFGINFSFGVGAFSHRTERWERMAETRIDAFVWIVASESAEFRHTRRGNKVLDR